MSAAKPSVSLLPLASAALGAAALALAAGAPAAAQLPACEGGSNGLVLSVSPASHSASIQRGGASARLNDLTMLCPGDFVTLGVGETALVDIQGSSDSSLEGPTQFQVPGGGGMLSNASVAVARLLFPEGSSRTQTLVSRNVGDVMAPRPEKLSVRLPQELALSSEPRALWFGWSGGAAPFRVTLEDGSGAVVAEAEITSDMAAAVRARNTDADGVLAALSYDVTFAPVALPAGDYRIRVADANSEPPEVAALMSDEDAGVLTMPVAVVEGLEGVPGEAASDLDRIVAAMCFSAAQPESRLFEAAQHVVAGRDGAPYAAALALLGSDAGAACP